MFILFLSRNILKKIIITNTNNNIIDKSYSNITTTIIRNIKPDKEKEKEIANNSNNNININPNNNYRFKTHYVNPLQRKEENNNNKKLGKTTSSYDITNKRKNAELDINNKKDEIKKEEKEIKKENNDDIGIFKNSIRNKYKRRKND